jgi:hypothetical protein
MLDPDIECRLQSLQIEHLAAVLDYMFGDHNGAARSRQEPRADGKLKDLLGLKTKAPRVDSGFKCNG